MKKDHDKLMCELSIVRFENANLKVMMRELLDAIDRIKEDKNKEAFYNVVKRANNTLYRLRENDETELQNDS